MGDQNSANASAKRRGLGKGLGALIVNTDPESLQPDEADTQPEHNIPAAGVLQISVDAIDPNPQQPRTVFDPDSLQELASSIREHGVIQPLVVMENPDQAGRYWLITGERRWRAAQLAQQASVPAIVRDASPQQLLELALVENVQRSDLNALEEAAAYQILVDRFDLKQEEIAQRVGRSRSAIANTLRLLHLPQDVQQALIAGSISAGHARALLSLTDESTMSDMLNRIQARALSVRQTEDLVKKMQQPLPEQKAGRQIAPPDAHVQYLEGQFRSALGTRVNLNRNKDGSGRLVVHFYNDDDLQHLYERFVEDADA